METKTLKTDVVIIGAGPAGLSASLFLSKHRIDHILLEKSVYPRDKICGDALSGKVTSILRDIDPEFITEIRKGSDEFEPSWGVIFSAPDGREVAVPFKHEPDMNKPSPGFIAKREDFDSFLASKVETGHCTFLQGIKIEDITISDDGVQIRTEDLHINAELALGADGTANVLGRKYLDHKLDKDHFCAGLRQYYEGVSDLNEDGYIELHFVQESLPGYFWIFPLPNGKANVGIGMLSSYISKHKVDLKKLMEQVIQSEKFKDRFRNATALETPKGWGLPLGSKKIALSGKRFMVLGDAASLIDPFTGEGIGNAMISGKIAAAICENAIKSKDYSADKLREFDNRIYGKLWGELRLSRILQKLIRYPWLFNWMIKKIATNKELKKTITFMFEDVNLRKQFTNPGFYIRLFFK